MSRSRYDDPAGPPSPAFRFLTARPAPAARLRWLWPQRLPIGSLTLLIGDPAVGKSLLTADLAACLTVPRPWPDDPAAERPDPASLPPLPHPLTEEGVYRSFPPIRGYPCREIPPAGAIFAAPEDGSALYDRLVAAGADPQYISVIDGVRPPFSKDILPLRLPGHADQLEETIRAHRQPRLVVLDPIHALLEDGVFSSADCQAGLLARLAALAHRRDVAILAVGHFSKAPARRVFYRIRGSLSLTAAARSILLLTADPDCPDRRILTQIKNAYGPPAPPLAFRIVSGVSPASAPAAARAPAVPASPSALQDSHSCAPPEDADPLSLAANPKPKIQNPESSADESPSAPAPPDSAAPHLEWSDPARSDWRLSTGVLDLSPESSSALSEACDWLTDLLSAGPRPSSEVLAAARAAGITNRTLFRAKRILAVNSFKDGAAWVWSPHAQSRQHCHLRPVKT
jgi:hypothetical protein